MTKLERELQDLRLKQQELGEEIEVVSQDLALLEAEIDEAETKLQIAQDRFVERAVSAYKGSSVPELALLLSARDLGDVMDVTHALSKAAELDAAALDGFAAARSRAETAQRRVDERKQELLEAKARVDVLEGEMESVVEARRLVLGELTDEIERLEAEARRRAALAARPSQALLDLLSPAGPTAGIPDGFVGTGVGFEGVASWYGPGFEGQSTASGDVFDPDLFTAASRDLPFGTWLYVQHEGRGVVVLVNDRGPYIDDRVLDLSRAAAYSIGITGIGWVEAEILLKR